jgi:hypothetical protein
MATAIIETIEIDDPEEWWEEALLRHSLFQQRIAQARQSAREGKCLSIEHLRAELEIDAPVILAPTESSEEEGVALLAPDREYPIWTPFNSFEAAETLMKVLENHKAAGA